MKLWEKGIDTDTAVEKFTIGRDKELDPLLAPYDVLGSIAHAIMLQEVGLLNVQECRALCRELRGINSSIEKDEFRIEPGVEDVHSQIELLLTRALGDTGKKIHTGRSRNDQVLLDLKMFMRTEIGLIAGTLHALAETLLEQSDATKDVLLPGYTHMQVAMPSSFGLWFAAYAESLAEDLLALQAAYRVVNRNPLGSAAGYGVGLPLDRQRTTELLGFEALNINVVHAQMTRGKSERSTAAALAGIAMTLNKLAADICLYMAPNFAFLTMPDSLSTGSSIMPHKKNPDVFELIRARCNKILALPNEIALLCTNLPSGYHRDFQLLKEGLLPAFADLRACMQIARDTIRQLEVRPDIMQADMYRYAFTVDAVNQLVLDGIPFRDAYRTVAHTVGDGSFSVPETLRHSHEGSIGNLCNDAVRSFLQAEMERFGFDRIDTAFHQLLNA